MSAKSSVTKVVDGKGRLNLGREFVGKTVIITETEEGLHIEKAAVIRERELWLYKNPAAFKSVMTGLEQLRNGEFAKTPPVIDMTVVDDEDEMGDNQV